MFLLKHWQLPFFLINDYINAIKVHLFLLEENAHERDKGVFIVNLAAQISFGGFLTLYPLVSSADRLCK